MRTTIKRLAVVGALTALVASSSAAVSASTVEASTHKASISVFHAIPAGLGVNVVDVYADGGRIINNLKSGEIKNLRVRPGTYDLEIYVNGERPQRDEPVLEIENVTFLAGTCSTVTANLDEVEPQRPMSSRTA